MSLGQRISITTSAYGQAHLGPPFDARSLQEKLRSLGYDGSLDNALPSLNGRRLCLPCRVKRVKVHTLTAPDNPGN
jgi:hypothetical protein